MDDHPGTVMAPEVAPDAELVARAREGDRVAFGVLYLRHHAAAWRLASATSRFSDDAELAVLAGFTDVFPTLPRTGDPAFRAHLLTCVRRAALDRGRTRASAGGDHGNSAGGTAVRAALAALPEHRRAALWLTDVEAMTPAEVAAVLDLDARAVPRLAREARAAVQATCAEATLASAADAPPLLGGECQRYWLTHRAEEVLAVA
jgi:DNA-directed RNA polymerase specialized sigma24 family protein